VHRKMRFRNVATQLLFLVCETEKRKTHFYQSVFSANDKKYVIV